MRKKFRLDAKNKRGITLVSLVITIIVLLILAGITINLIIGEDGIIKRAQQAGKNYIDAAEEEKVQLGLFTNEMDNIISSSTNNGRVQYNSEFRKNVVEAIKKAGVETTENDTDETIVTNIGKILQETTKNATATADNISEGKTAWVNGELITGNGSDIAAYKDQIKVEIQEKIVHSLYNNNMYVAQLGDVFFCTAFSAAFETGDSDSASGSMTIPIYKTPDGKSALMTSLSFDAVQVAHRNHAYDSAGASLNYTVVTDEGKNLSGTTINMIECGIGDATEITISGSGSVSADGGNFEQCRAWANAGIQNVKATYIMLD